MCSSVTDEEDDEVVISAQKNFASGGMGYQTPVPVMTHDDFQEKNIEKINEVLVIHFANFCKSPLPNVDIHQSQLKYHLVHNGGFIIGSDFIVVWFSVFCLISPLMHRFSLTIFATGLTP